jgi:hypothetical protein
VCIIIMNMVKESDKNGMNISDSTENEIGMRC